MANQRKKQSSAVYRAETRGRDDGNQGTWEASIGYSYGPRGGQGSEQNWTWRFRNALLAQMSYSQKSLQGGNEFLRGDLHNRTIMLFVSLRKRLKTHLYDFRSIPLTNGRGFWAGGCCGF